MVQGVLSKRNALAKAHEMLAEAGLGEFGGKYPGEVSSGMARRAEIVRALINKPKVLLLDEPYRAMDGLTKSIMHEALLRYTIGPRSPSSSSPTTSRRRFSSATASTC